MKNERISAEEIILAEEHVNEAGIAGYGMRSYGVMTACEGGECDRGSYDDSYDDNYVDDSECGGGYEEEPDDEVDDSECEADTDSGSVPDENIDDSECCGDSNGNDSGKMLKSNDDAGTGFNFKIRYNLIAGQTYYIRVRSYDDNTGYFNISIEIDTVLVESVDIDDTSGILNIGDSAYLNVTVLPSDAVNKSLTWESSNPEIISVNASGRLTAHAFGSAVITATAQDGSLVCGSCTVYCDTYLYSLVNLFEFTKEVALLIRELYNKVDDIFADETEMQKAWKCARLLGGIIYGNDTPDTFSEWKWVDVAGEVSSNEKNYFIKLLRYSEAEYSQIKEKIIEQRRSSNRPDFAHMQIALAARLAYKLNLDGKWSNIGTISSDEEVSYLAGWLGDAFNEYYSQIFSGANRTEIFLGYISYEYVQEKVFYELIDVELLALITVAKSSGENEKVDY